MSFGVKGLLIVGIVALSASLAAYVYVGRTNEPLAYFSMPLPLWELIAGALVFVAINRQSTLRTYLEKLDAQLHSMN